MKLCDCSEIEQINNLLHEKFIFTAKKKEEVIISNNDIRFVEGYFRMTFLLKLNDYGILNQYYLNFEERYNDMIKRDNQNINFYNFINIIANEYDTHFKLIIPKFKAYDLYYLFILPSSDNEDLYNVGPLLTDFKNISLRELNKSMKKNNENNLKESNFEGIIDEILEKLISEKEHENINFTNHSELYNKYIKPKETEEFYKMLNLGYDIAHFIMNDYDSRKKDIEKYKLKYDDLSEFTIENIKKGYNYFIKNEYLSNKYPSLIFYLGKYKRNIEALFKIFEEKGLELKENEKNVPFWVVCFRILSSFCCINYGQNIFEKADLEAFIKEELQDS
jgi:hypothetical protein